MGQRVGRRRVWVRVPVGRGMDDGVVGEGEEGEEMCRQPQV